MLFFADGLSGSNLPALLALLAVLGAVALLPGFVALFRRSKGTALTALMAVLALFVWCNRPIVVEGLRVAPGNCKSPRGTMAQVRVWAVYSDGGTSDLDDVRWTSPTGLAIFPGNLTARAERVGTTSRSLGRRSASLPLTVVDASLQRLLVDPVTQSQADSRM